jgi:YHS domain-containing protein
MKTDPTSFFCRTHRGHRGSGSRQCIQFVPLPALKPDSNHKRQRHRCTGRRTANAVSKGKVNVDRNGVILKGYDPVAYFTLHRAVKGKPSIQSGFGGAIYHFASEADKVAFDKEPSRYVPQYRAFCANYVKKGKLRDIDPMVFFIYKGKLYVCSAADEAKGWMMPSV